MIGSGPVVVGGCSDTTVILIQARWGSRRDHGGVTVGSRWDHGGNHGGIT
eukprot:gene10592-biopygen742